VVGRAEWGGKVKGCVGGSRHPALPPPPLLLLLLLEAAHAPRPLDVSAAASAFHCCRWLGERVQFACSQRRSRISTPSSLIGLSAISHTPNATLDHTPPAVSCNSSLFSLFRDPRDLRGLFLGVAVSFT